MSASTTGFRNDNGHPFAATGLWLARMLERTPRNDDAGLGIASACVGGGQGVALVLERC